MVDNNTARNIVTELNNRFNEQVEKNESGKNTEILNHPTKHLKK